MSSFESIQSTAQRLAPSMTVPASLSDTVFDVVVAGAGPAGSAAAATIAAAGLRVALVEKNELPRDKPCGDCLLPDAVNALRELDALDAVTQHSRLLTAASVFSPSGFEFEVPGKYYILPRRLLDTILVRAAVATGAELVRARVDSFEIIDDRVRIRFSGTQPAMWGRVLVVATGHNLRLMRSAGAVNESTPYAFARRCYVESPVAVDRMLLAYDKSIAPGYMWLIPAGDNLYNVGCGIVNRPGIPVDPILTRAFEIVTAEHPVTSPVVRAGRIVDPLRGAALRCALIGAPPVWRDRVLSVGETLGTTFPFTGEGIGKALESGRMAGEAVVSAIRSGNIARLSEYAQRVDDDLRPQYRGYVKAQRWLAIPSVNDFLARRIQNSEFLRGLFAEFMSQTGDPRRVFALWKLISSCWKK